jgi:hypothetical protein
MIFLMKVKLLDNRATTKLLDDLLDSIPLHIRGVAEDMIERAMKAYLIKGELPTRKQIGKIISNVSRSMGVFTFYSAAAYLEIRKIVKSHFKAEFFDISTNHDRAIQKLALQEGTMLNQIYAKRVNDIFIDDMANKRTASYTRKRIQNLFIGKGEGRSFLSYATQLSFDRQSEYFNAVNKLTAKDAGITKYEYYGTSIDDTRPFCRGHIGEVKTEKEWRKIGQGDWAGKRGSDIFVSVGGHFCRHHLMAIVDEDQ